MTGLVYWLKFENVGLYYVGSYKGKPEDILNKYFSSSKVVKKLIEKYGLNSVKCIKTKEFDSYIESVIFEDKFLRAIKKKEIFVNINFSAGGNLIKSQTHVCISKDGVNHQLWPKNENIPEGYFKFCRNVLPNKKGHRKFVSLDGKFSREYHPDRVPAGCEDWILFKQYQKTLPRKTECITNGIDNTKIVKGELPPVGWWFGKRVTKGLDRKKYIRTGVNSTKDTKAYNDGERNYFLREGQAPPANFVKGFLPRKIKPTKNKRHITNGVKNTMISMNNEPPEGWWFGKTTFKKK